MGVVAKQSDRLTRGLLSGLVVLFLDQQARQAVLRRADFGRSAVELAIDLERRANGGFGFVEFRL